MPRKPTRRKAETRHYVVDATWNMKSKRIPTRTSADRLAKRMRAKGAKVRILIVK